MTTKRGKLGWTILLTGVLLFIIVPFALFGQHIEGWYSSFVTAAAARKPLVAAVLGSLLASDILLPIPSSIISTACGSLLGLWAGALVSLLGMSFSCTIGFWLGSLFGRPLAARLVGQSELERLGALARRYGDWVIIITRPVPVLAEAAILFAGVSRMNTARFFLLTSLSNAGISAVYAAVGAFSTTVNSFLLALAGAIAIPGIAMLLFRRPSQKESHNDHH